METTIYEISTEQKAQIEGKIKELLAACQVAGVPMFVSCAIANSETETTYLREVYSPQANEISLSDDHIRKHMLIASGSHDAVLKRQRILFDPQTLFGKSP